MDIQLKDFLEKIKAEGVVAGQAEAAAVLAKAQTEAQNLRTQGENQARSELEKARAEIARLEAAQKAALLQAGRDLLLNIRHQVDELFRSLLTQTVGQALQPQFIEKLLLELVSQWKPDSATLQLSPSQAADLEKSLQATLSAKLKGGLEIQPNPRLAKGFRISQGKEGAFFDWSDEALAQVLAASVSPATAEILNKAAKA